MVHLRLPKPWWALGVAALVILALLGTVALVRAESPTSRCLSRLAQVVTATATPTPAPTATPRPRLTATPAPKGPTNWVAVYVDYSTRPYPLMYFTDAYPSKVSVMKWSGDILNTLQFHMQEVGVLNSRTDHNGGHRAVKGAAGSAPHPNQCLPALQYLWVLGELGPILQLGS